MGARMCSHLASRLPSRVAASLYVWVAHSKVGTVFVLSPLCLDSLLDIRRPSECSGQLSRLIPPHLITFISFLYSHGHWRGLNVPLNMVTGASKFFVNHTLVFITHLSSPPALEAATPCRGGRACVYRWSYDLSWKWRVADSWSQGRFQTKKQLNVNKSNPGGLCAW